MSKNVRVLPGDRGRRDTATLLLAAAEESKDFDVDVVQVSSYGGYVVPEEIAKAAGVDYEDVEVAMGHVYSEEELAEAADTPLEGPNGDIEPEADSDAEPAKKAPAKKAPAKKTTAKKTTAKKGASR